MTIPKYNDVEILCGDKINLYGCREILASSSEVFDRLLYNGTKEMQISFPKINYSEMKIVLEYIHTGSIKEGSLTKDNIVEAFYAADYFLLPDLQNIIIKTVKNNLEKNHAENYSPELLSKIADTMPLSDDNILLNLLVETVSAIPLNTIGFVRLSIAALQFLLACTHEKEVPFATNEYEVFRYSAILAAKQVSNEECKTLTERLPTLEQIKNSVQVESKSIANHQEVAKTLVPLIKFIDFTLIRDQTLANIIEPLGIIPIKIMLKIYRDKSHQSSFIQSEFRGASHYI